MAYPINFTLATSNQIEAALCNQIERIRLSRNITQLQLSEEAGVSLRTIGRLEKGEGVSLDTFIRVMMALGLQQNLKMLLPEPSIKPIERVGIVRKERKRAHPSSSSIKKQRWTWGDGGGALE